MDKALKLVVSLLAGVMCIAVIMALLYGVMVAVAFIASHGKAFALIVCITIIVIMAWAAAYDVLFGD